MSETKVNERKVVGTNIAIALGIICIILAAGIGVLFIQFQNQISSILALKTEIEKPNVSVLTYSWQDSPSLPSYNVLSFNCTLINTGFQPALNVTVILTIHNQGNVSKTNYWTPHDIPARQTAIMTGMIFIHNNATIYYITIEIDWLGGSSGNIINTWD